MKLENTEKLPYTRPELTRKGSVAELTQQTPKQYGLSDSFFLIPNTPIKNLS